MANCAGSRNLRATPESELSHGGYDRTVPSRDDELELEPERKITLCETLDRVLNKGVVLAGEIIISVADIDLVYLNVQVLLASVEADRRAKRPSRTRSGWTFSAMEPHRDHDRRNHTFDVHHGCICRSQCPLELRVAIRPDDVRNGLGKLVLTLVELIRQLLERQAIRRIEAGSLADDEIERLGITFLQLGEQMTSSENSSVVEEDELNLDLGPLGKLL